MDKTWIIHEEKNNIFTLINYQMNKEGAFQFTFSSFSQLISGSIKYNNYEKHN